MKKSEVKVRKDEDRIKRTFRGKMIDRMKSQVTDSQNKFND